MNKRTYNILNTTFLAISFLLIILLLKFNYLFNIVPQILLLFEGISLLLSGKFKFKKINNFSFKQQFTLGILITIFSTLLIIGAIISTVSF